MRKHIKEPLPTMQGEYLFPPEGLCIDHGNIMLDMLPYEAHSDRADLLDSIRQNWDAELFRENFKYARVILKAMGQAGTRLDQGGTPGDFKFLLSPLLTLSDDELSEMYLGYRDSAPVLATMNQEIGNLEPKAPSSKSQFVFDLTSSHEMLDDRLLEIERSDGTNPEEVGIIIFDNHCDCKVRRLDEKRFNGDYINDLLNSGYKVGLLGALPSWVEAAGGKTSLMIHPQSIISRVKNHTDPYNPGFDMIEIDTMFQRMIKKGVKKVVISIDPDVVDGVSNGLTGWPYNTINKLGLMGVNSWREVLDHNGINLADCLDDPQKAQRIIEHAMATQPEDFKLILTGLTRVIVGDVTQRIIRKRLPEQGTAFSPSVIQLKQFLKRVITSAQEYGLEIGVPYTQPNGEQKAYIGGITELAGIDYMGKTARFALDLGNTMIRAISTN